MNQGDVYLINLDPALHTETGKTRPGLIISIDEMNRYSPRVIIAPITSSIGKLYPFEIFIAAGTGGLTKDSKLMLDQIRSLDKRRLVKKLGNLDKETIATACSIAQKLITAGSISIQ
jgi:mRNA interferase MazF